MTPRRRSLALALLAAALPLAACAGPRLALDAPDLDPDARAARAKAALTTHAAASERAAAHLELAWLCLLHGQSCAELPRHADAAVAFAPEMTLAQLTRAIGLQGSDDVGARARAWLDLALWAALSADPDARALGPLAAIDAKATRAVLRDGVVAIDAALAAADPRARHGVRAALDGLLASAEVPMLAAEDSAATALAVRQHRAPLHPRAHIGQSRLEPGWAIALDAEPDAGWLPLVADRRGTLAGRRYRLPSGDLGVFALRVEADVTAGAGDHRALLVDSPRPLRLADGTRLPPGRHLLPAAGAEVVRAASDNGAPQPTPAATPQRLRWTLAISRIARPDAIAFALVALPTNAAAPPPASRPPPAPMATTFARRAIARVVALMTAFERGSADLKAAVADRGALPALLAFDVEGARAPVAVLDRVLDHRDDHLDAAVARAARARDDGQGAVGHGLLAPLLQRLERGDSRIAARADLLLELGWAALGDGLGDLAAAYAERAVAAQPGHCPRSPAPSSSPRSRSSAPPSVGCSSTNCAAKTRRCCARRRRGSQATATAPSSTSPPPTLRRGPRPSCAGSRPSASPCRGGLASAAPPRPPSRVRSAGTRRNATCSPAATLPPALP
jgi:hypothetical protein